jgi:hypothetical protein
VFKHLLQITWVGGGAFSFLPSKLLASFLDGAQKCRGVQRPAPLLYLLFSTAFVAMRIIARVPRAVTARPPTRQASPRHLAAPGHLILRQRVEQEMASGERVTDRVCRTLEREREMEGALIAQSNERLPATHAAGVPLEMSTCDVCGRHSLFTAGLPAHRTAKLRQADNTPSLIPCRGVPPLPSFRTSCSCRSFLVLKTGSCSRTAAGWRSSTDLPAYHSRANSARMHRSSSRSHGVRGELGSTLL